MSHDLNPDNLKVLHVENATLENHLRAAAERYEDLVCQTRNFAASSDHPAEHNHLADNYERSAVECEAWADAIGNDSILVTN